MLRSLIKTGVAVALHRTNSDRLLATLGGTRPVPLVIGYHRTVEEFPTDALRTIPSMCISTKMLERQLDWIGRRFRFVSLDELGALQESGHRAAERVAAVTFDDGYHDFYEHAFPLLKRKGIPAAVFVVTDLVGTSRLQIHDHLYLLLARAVEVKSRILLKLGITLAVPSDPHAAVEVLLGSLPQSVVLRVIEALQNEVNIEEDILREHRALTREAIVEMRAAGVTFGSHTHTHALLPNEDTGRVENELRISREKLETWLGEKVRHFAFPCGQFNAATVGAVAQAGYRYGYTICKHRDSSFPLLTMPRKLLWENSCLDALGSFSPSIMSCHVHGAFDLVSSCKLQHASVAARVNPRGGLFRAGSECCGRPA